MTSKLNKLLPDTDNRKVRKSEFHAYWIDIDGKMKYNIIKLKADNGLIVIWRSFHPRLTKGPIEIDVKISIPIDDIIKILKRPESFCSV